MANRESKIELWVTWDDEKDDHPESWVWEVLLGATVNRVKITDVEEE